MRVGDRKQIKTKYIYILEEKKKDVGKRRGIEKRRVGGEDG